MNQPFRKPYTRASKCPGGVDEIALQGRERESSRSGFRIKPGGCIRTAMSHPSIMIQSLAFILSLTCAGTISAETLQVPADYPTIQSGIDASSIDDTILVSAGTYFEIVVIPHRLMLLSEEGPLVTTIDAQGQGIAVFASLQAEGTTIDGFRVTNGFANSGSHAGGIHIDVDFGVGGRAVITNNIVEWNRSYGWVGGIFAVRASTVEDNLIQYYSV